MVEGAVVDLVDLDATPLDALDNLLDDELGEEFGVYPSPDALDLGDDFFAGLDVFAMA